MGKLTEEDRAGMEETEPTLSLGYQIQFLCKEGGVGISIVQNYIKTLDR